MAQLGLFGLTSPVLTVSDLTRHVRSLLDTDYRLQDVWVSGEVSNLSRPASGHLYFTLKDAQASLRCVMWRPEAARLPLPPREGQAIEAHGRVSVYEAGGQYQLYTDTLRPAGEGILFQEFLRLKARLEAEGLFEAGRKRPLPDWPLRIGLVTSPSGAALRDVVHVLGRRFPLAEVTLAPTPVQGDEAPAGILAALKALARARPDVILLVRGGGSMEDLAAFNDEQVARAIAASPVPVVTGVGHETDFTIADFVADRRAATPSAAAEITTPDLSEHALARRALSLRLGDALGRQLRHRRGALEALHLRLRLASPRAQVAGARQRLDDLLARAGTATTARMRLMRSAVDGLAQTLRAVGPAAVLARGYAVVSLRPAGEVVRSTGQVRPGAALEVRVSDGVFPARSE
ncbi:MAG: exodeoxyribonuclease VII large subunit [Chloroflexi bacterium]|nr:exodeoxyribonuclease VII large subunit [Chloroflexota bacterium]